MYVPKSISGITVEPPLTTISPQRSTTFSTTALFWRTFCTSWLFFKSLYNQMATFFCPQGGLCEEAFQLYNLVHFVSCVMFKCTSLSACKEIVSDNSGLVDFAIRPVRSIVKFPNRQVMFFRELKSQRNRNQTCSSKIFFFVLVETTFGLVHANYNLPEWQAVKVPFSAPCIIMFKRFRRICCCCRFELALQQNEILDVFYDDYLSLADDETTFGAKSDNYLKVMWYIMNHKTKAIKSYNFTC